MQQSAIALHVELVRGNRTERASCRERRDVSRESEPGIVHDIVDVTRRKHEITRPLAPSSSMRRGVVCLEAESLGRW